MFNHANPAATPTGIGWEIPGTVSSTTLKIIERNRDPCCYTDPRSFSDLDYVFEVA
jgi:hypothetical protein